MRRFLLAALVSIVLLSTIEQSLAVERAFEFTGAVDFVSSSATSVS